MKINLDFIYPIGALYITTSTVSPEVSFGGKWEQIVNDAYLKIVNSSTEIGQLNGSSSNHVIPAKCVPSHTHTGPTNTINDGFMAHATGGSGFTVLQQTTSGYGVYVGGSTGDVVGGAANKNQPYYPYYYGVYVWKRIA